MGEDKRRDDPSIPNSELLYRRIGIKLFNQDTGQPNSNAFDNGRDPEGTSPNSMSVALDSELKNLSKKPEDILVGYENCGVVSLTAELVRDCDQIVVRDDTEDPAHAHVVGKKTKGIKRRLAAECTWVIRPPGV